LIGYDTTTELVALDRDFDAEFLAVNNELELMSAQTVRATTHQYPQEEIRAMQDFYRGFKCVILNSESLNGKGGGEGKRWWYDGDEHS